MTTILNASNGATSGLIATGDNSGVLQLQTNNGTPALTLNATQALGVGSSPSYGTSGQVLTSGGTSASPTWTTPSSGAMTLISTKNASSGLVWTGLSGYNNYILVFNNLSYNNASLVNLYIQLGTGATPTYTTSGYYTNSSGRTDNNGSFTPAANTSLNAAQGNLNANLNWFTNTSSFNGYIHLTGFTSSASQGVLSYMCFQDTTNIIYGFMNDSVTNTITSPITAIRLYGNTSSSTFGGGTASLYGISS